MRLMRSRIRSWPAYANIATLALVVATTGGTLAATSSDYVITSTTQISPKVLRALKGRTGAAGRAGPQGEAGEAGPAGETGPASKEDSPWTAGGTLPSGKTETGTWAFTKNAEGQIRVPISFPIPTNQPLKPTLGRGPVEFSAPKKKIPSMPTPTVMAASLNQKPIRASSASTRKRSKIRSQAKGRCARAASS